MSTRVLVVDDEKCIRDLFEFVMSKKGCDVKCADSEEAAKELCKTERFDIAFVDVVLGDKEGNILVEELSQLYPSTIYCLLTGHPDKFADIQKDYAARGISLRIMLKPVWQEQILEAARELLGKGADSQYSNIKADF